MQFKLLYLFILLLISCASLKDKDLFSSLYEGDWSQWEGIKHAKKPKRMVKASISEIKNTGKLMLKIVLLSMMYVVHILQQKNYGEILK